MRQSFVANMSDRRQAGDESEQEN